MKKLIASVLAAASVLPMSATTFAVDTKTVTKTGEVSYDVAVAVPKIVLDLVMPAKTSSALNPYGADIVLFEGESNNTSDKGIASVAYTIENKTTDYGVWIDATTITTTDKAPERGVNAWDVKASTVVAGTKSAQLALIAAADNAGFATAAKTVPAVSAKQTAEATFGKLVLDSSVAADKENDVVAGQTSQDSFLYIAAAGSATIGFTGELAKDSADKKVVWNEDDAINVNLVLKVNAGPKAFPTA